MSGWSCVFGTRTTTPGPTTCANPVHCAAATKRRLNSSGDDLMRRIGSRRHQQHAVQELVPIPVVWESVQVADRVMRDGDRHRHKVRLHPAPFVPLSQEVTGFVSPSSECAAPDGLD